MPSSVPSPKRSIARTSSVSGRRPRRGRRGSARATHVAILGGGRGGRALLEMFAQDPLARLVGLAETKAETTGTELARQLGVPVTHDYREILNMTGVDLIIDVTGSPEVEKALQKIRKPSVAIIGGASAKFMWRLIDARIRATTEIEKTLTRYQSLFRRYVKEEAESAVDEERTRIACEIHDGLVQTLVGVNFKIERCGELIQQEPTKCFDLMNEAQAQLKQGIQEARQVVFNLQPGQYERLDLVSALSNYLDAYQKQHRVRADFSHVGSDARLHPKTKVFVFRIIQEALQNSSKHAKATTVRVELTIHHDALSAAVSDNGIGFDVHAVSRDPDKWDHFGLRGMKERAKLLGGEASWTSQKGLGTTVSVCIPLARKDETRNGKEREGADRR